MVGIIGEGLTEDVFEESIYNIYFSLFERK